MGDWFDRLISLLGLDASRTDRIVGTLEREILELSLNSQRPAVKVGLYRLPDDRRQLVFQLGTQWVGFLPCSRGNEKVLADFLGRAQRYLPPDSTAPKPAPPGVFRRMAGVLARSRRLEAMGPLPDSHLRVSVGLELLEIDDSHLLSFIIRGPRGMLRERIAWTRELAAQLQALHEVVQGSLTPWPSDQA